jgi:hypothetical protein
MLQLFAPVRVGFSENGRKLYNVRRILAVDIATRKPAVMGELDCRLFHIKWILAFNWARNMNAFYTRTGVDCNYENSTREWREENSIHSQGWQAWLTNESRLQSIQDRYLLGLMSDYKNSESEKRARPFDSGYIPVEE